MTMPIDLHIHTHASEDGEFSPRKIFDLAGGLGLRAIAFADHDTVASVGEGVALSKATGIDFAPAVEITTQTEGYDLHLLGYFIDWRSPRLHRVLSRSAERRVDTVATRAQLLRGLGFTITLEDILKDAAGRPPGTASILNALKTHPENLKCADFARYITGDKSDRPVYNFYRDYLFTGGPAFVDMRTMSTVEAIALVHELGGAAVLAHPGRTPAELVDRLLGAALDGLEVFCSTHSAEDSARFGEYARRHGLLETAGSDFHGPSIKPDIVFGADLPGGTYEMFTALRERADQRRRR